MRIKGKQWRVYSKQHRVSILIPLVITEFSFWRKTWPSPSFPRWKSPSPERKSPSPETLGAAGAGVGMVSSEVETSVGNSLGQEANDIGAITSCRNDGTFQFLKPCYVLFRLVLICCALRKGHGPPCERPVDGGPDARCQDAVLSGRLTWKAQSIEWQQSHLRRPLLSAPCHCPCTGSHPVQLGGQMGEQALTRAHRSKLESPLPLGALQRPEPCVRVGREQ